MMTENYWKKRRGRLTDDHILKDIRRMTNSISHLLYISLLVGKIKNDKSLTRGRHIISPTSQMILVLVDTFAISTLVTRLTLGRGNG